MIKTSQFSKKLLLWYAKHGRHDLPWQKNPTPYRVWISEIMLQQTQVAAVIPYYHRFIKSFPTVKSLATATEDEVLSHWSGLGYYARARNIHKTAKMITEQYRGKFPNTVEALHQLPGIGKSTAGAIISFSFQKKAVILDGNVKRILARIFAIDKPINQLTTQDEMWDLAEQLTPEKNAHQYNQAIMDLGATLCTRTKPRCHDCPHSAQCQAYLQKQPTFYPIKTAKKIRPVKKTTMLVIQNNAGDILLLKRPSKGIWGGLWSFSENDNDQPIHSFRDHQLKYIATLPTLTHQFTHFTLQILPLRYSITSAIIADDLFWYTIGETLPIGIPTPVMNILKSLTRMICPT